MDIAKYEGILKELQFISQAAGIPVEYTQGGGGNTSAKLDDRLMAVKASGCKLKQITPTEGYVVVDYKNIREFIESIGSLEGRDVEKEGSEFVKGNITEIEGMKKLRPSVEAGFHSVLRKFVIHTHTVYSNILCCSKNGRESVERIFRDKAYATAWVPYVNPGFRLSIEIGRIASDVEKETGVFPGVIFMENHGLIVTDDDSRKCEQIHRDVNDTIRHHYGLTDTFPEIELFSVDDNTHISKTGYLADYFKTRAISADFFDRCILYPDQLVYLNGSLSTDGVEGKLNINTRTGEIIYKTSLAEAQTIEETLLAYVYVLEGVSKSGLELQTMPQSGSEFIRNWESEAYRKRLAGGGK